MSKSNSEPDRAAAVILVLHIAALFAGFMILGAYFEFPDILRAPAEERFALFIAHESVIRTTYWMLTMTGVSQILIAVLLFRVLRAPSQTAALIGLVFGVLAGLCQAFGFGRWVILIPYLAAQAQDPAQAPTAALLEGAFNHYAGMLAGEHLANIFWGVWLAATCVAFLIGTTISRALALFGLALSALLILLAGEQIGVSGAVLDPLVDFGFPLLAVWHFLLAAQLWRRNGAAAFPRMGRLAWISGGALASAMMAPALA